MSPDSRRPIDGWFLDEEGLLAHYAQWRGRVSGRPVAALARSRDEGDTVDDDAMLFVENEAIVDGDDHDLVRELVERFGAEVVADRELPPPPEGLLLHGDHALPEGRRQMEEQAPLTVRLRFAEPPDTDGIQMDDGLVATSLMGAAVAGVVARRASQDRPIGLNLLGQTLTMPLSTATEGPVPVAGANPFAWTAFGGRSRVVEAWQLVDSVRQLRGDEFTTLAVLDDGFWLDGAGVPFVAAGQAASDFGPGIMQVNLMNEGTPAGGMSPTGAPWHGNAVASAAAAAVNNAVGAAGSGGTVTAPVLFRTDISVDQILRCVRMCAAWGIDVLNMSIGTWGQTELFFPTSSWDNTFRFAADNGVVMICAAGNDTLDLPDDRNIRPATRTPGVLTVGALDANDNAAGFSNYGSSVGLWAPGTSVPVAPDQNNAAGSRVNGTSFASPIVAGVAAMMRFVAPGLSAADVRRILVDTAWPGTGRVSRGLDAFAAVFAALQQRLPDYHEPNNTPATARQLLPTGPGGALEPGLGAFSARSSSSDPDYWSFAVERFSTVTVAVDWYERLGSLYVAVEAVDPDARGAEEMVRGGSPSSGGVTLTGLLPPGGYRVRIGGNGVTAYRLRVTRRRAYLSGDQFEDNDSFDTAARLLFETRPWSLRLLRSWGPGTYDATLHERLWLSPLVGGGARAVDDDYFRLEVPTGSVFRRPTVSVSDADQPVNVTLYDADRRPIKSWTGVKSMKAYPPTESICFLVVTGKGPTRYRISALMTVDASVLPGPLQEELELFPKWWGDPPPLRLGGPVVHYLHEVAGAAVEGRGIVLEGGAGRVRLELLDLEGSVLREGEEVDGTVRVETRGLDAGDYVLRLTRDDETTEPIALRTVPPIGGFGR